VIVRRPSYAGRNAGGTLTRDEITADLIGILSAEADLDPADVTEESSLVIDLEIDSLLMVEIVVMVEGHFGVTLPKKELAEDIQLVSDLVTHIEKSLAT
jgi:acyl carrier protein